VRYDEKKRFFIFRRRTLLPELKNAFLFCKNKEEEHYEID